MDTVNIYSQIRTLIYIYVYCLNDIMKYLKTVINEITILIFGFKGRRALLGFEIGGQNISIPAPTEIPAATQYHNIKWIQLLKKSSTLTTSDLKLVFEVSSCARSN